MTDELLQDLAQYKTSKDKSELFSASFTPPNRLLSASGTPPKRGKESEISPKWTPLIFIEFKLRTVKQLPSHTDDNPTTENKNVEC